MKSEVLRAVVRDGRTAMEYQIQPGEMMDGIVLKQCKEGAFDGVLLMKMDIIICMRIQTRKQHWLRSCLM